MAVSVDEVFDQIVEESVDKRQQGTRWERAVQWFLTQDPAWRDRFEHVWMWDDAPTNPGRQDTGIDLVAQDTDGEYWAIQAKCYSKTLSDKDVSTFFMASMADTRYWIGNGVLDRFLEDESLFGEFLRTPVSEGGVESLVVEPPHIVVEVGA